MTEKVVTLPVIRIERHEGDAMTEPNKVLKPCPCCGCDAIASMGSIGHAVTCSNAKCCLATGTFPTMPMARSAWNKRAPQPNEPKCDRCGSVGDTFVLCAGCQSPIPSRPATASFDATARMDRKIDRAYANGVKACLAVLYDANARTDQNSPAFETCEKMARDRFEAAALATQQPNQRGEREALRPFAKLADRFDHYEAEPGKETVFVTVSLTDLRNARDVIAVEPEREFAADMNPVDDAEFGMKP